MSTSRLHGFLSRFADIKPGEERLAVFFFCYFFFITAPYSVIKSVRDARYLDEVGSAWLPVAYLLTALIMGLVVALQSKLQIRVRSSLLIAWSLLFFTLTAAAFWQLFRHGWAWVPVVFWVWANVFIVILVTQFWILVNEVFNPREAKRLIGFFGSGGILGGVLGGVATGFLGRTRISDDLLLIAAAMLLADVLMIRLVFAGHEKSGGGRDQASSREPSPPGTGPEAGFKSCYETVRKDNYLRLLAAVVLVTGIVSTLIDWQSKNVIENTMTGRLNLTAFFGYFNAGVLIFPFFLQLLITSNFIRRFGIRTSLLIYPVILLLCSIGIAAAPVLFFAVMIKGNDKSLSFSLNQSVRELLYIPISPAVKYRAKIFIDMFLNRVAKGLGAVLLMALIFIPLPFGRPFRIQLVSIWSAAFIMGWILLNIRISREYTNTVKQKLEAKWDRPDRRIAEKLDLDYARLVFDAIESRERSSVLYAMHLFDLIRQDRLTPEVKRLIGQKADEMRITPLGALFEAEDTNLIPATDEWLPPDVVKKEVQEILSLDVYQEVMRSYIEKALASDSRENETVKMEVAKALGMLSPDSPLAAGLEGLLEERSPAVARYALQSAGNLGKRDYLPAVIRKLGSPMTREDALEALEKYGPRIPGTLSDFLGDAGENLEVRKGVSQALARISNQDAADYLLWQLDAGEEDLAGELIDGLDKIRCEKPAIRFSGEAVSTALQREIRGYFGRLVASRNPDRRPGRKGREAGVETDLNKRVLNIFKLLGLVYPHEDIFRAYQNVLKGTKESIAYAVELLDNTLDKDSREAVLAIVEDIPLAERIERYNALDKGARRS